MNPAHFSDVRPCVALLTKHERLAANMFEGFGRELNAV
jgi:hypothetical protein